LKPPTPEISVVIPARDEERYIGAAVTSVHGAARRAALNVEIVVVLNRCSDRTEAIARSLGARTIVNDERCLAAIRNSGVRSTTAPIVVTLDADSRMSRHALADIKARLDSGRYAGGGCLILPERWSLGIALSGLALVPYALWHRISAGMFWTTRRDFDAIGGFDESMVSVEDIEFAQRLKRHARATGRRFGTLWRGSITTSCHKFDHFGDWHLLRSPGLVRALMSGKSREAANRYYYDFER
jgi:glycosyltransferase involved in cell wall biosynthesis